MSEWNWKQMDELDQDIEARRAKRLEEALRDPEGSGLLPLISIAEWQGDPPKREFAWGDWIPLHQATMLTGQGGVGKSLAMQMLCTSTVLGRPFLGMETRQMNALYLTAEDDADELWRRQAAICEALNVPISAVRGKLHLVSLAGNKETSLAEWRDQGEGHKLVATELWQRVHTTANLFDIRFSALDNATDLMAGDHNDVHQVAAFVNMLTGLAIKTNGVALILHHPNKGGDDWLGSVAWHNKVRSRLIMKFGEDEADPDSRTIENPKANYGPSRGKIEFRWHRGAFIRDDDLPADTRAEMNAVIAANGENAAFLDCLRERAAQGDGRAVGPSPGPNYAPSQFEGMAAAKGYKKPALKRAMDRLFTLGKIESAEVFNSKAKRFAHVIREVPGAHNAAHNARTTLSHNGAQLAAQLAAAHTVGTTYHTGAAIDGPAPPVDDDPFDPNTWAGEA